MKNAEDEVVAIPSDGVTVGGNLNIPPSAKGIVIFAHGSGSSRFSPRNTKVAREINKSGTATLLIDLLTQQEETEDIYSREFRFNIDLLAQRLLNATKWIKANLTTRNLAVGYFGASTGAAAALVAAAELPHWLKAIVSRGGRPDLAGTHLSEVKAPTLLIVGGNDLEVLELNMKAKEMMTTKTEIAIVPGATHLFEEPGKLEQVAKLSIEWFSNYLR